MSQFDPAPVPTLEKQRIESLDVFRGFGLLGILLLNIIGFGLLSPSYSNPGFDLANSGLGSYLAWGCVEILAEGAMRALFSMLFGAGVILFTTGIAAKSAWTHYKRTFWLLIIGLFNAYVLLWNGDILVTYALAGAILYLFRNKSARSLFIMATILILLMSALHGATQFGLRMSFEAAERVNAAAASTPVVESSAADQELAVGWEDFMKDFALSPEGVAEEIFQRTDNYSSAFNWNAYKNAGVYGFVLPVFLLWDALAMMMLGMGLYKTGVLQAQRSESFYLKLMAAGFCVGLVINSYEVIRAYQSEFNIFETFAQMQISYHFGRLGMALGYIGLLGWVCKRGSLTQLTTRLSAVGRMALTNYLMHSLVCALIFTGLGLGLVGSFERAQLYGIVLGIWLFQLWLSPLWLRHYKFGPVEWLWRMLTYGEKSAFLREPKRAQ